MSNKVRKNKSYSPQFKVKVVEDYLSGKSGGLDTLVKKYYLKSNTQIRHWLKLYREDPQLLSQENRGRKSTGRPKKSTLDELTLEEQNRYLRMENAILKKYHSLLKEAPE